MKRLMALILMLVLVFSLVPNVTFAEEGDPPAHSKTSEDNGDGTHKITLSVTGDSKDDVQEAGNVNILIVYDVSQSMSTTAQDSRNSRADEAEDVMHGFLTNLARYQNTAKDNINLAIETFSTSASQPSGFSGWTTNVSGVANLFDEGTGDNSVRFTYNGGKEELSDVRYLPNRRSADRQ